ncbi:MAG: hypothetical protein A2096_13760 [Spirochaetes bacterium GWF1_41_5]|nr:MAG: hypothetical protein A2096_13760 [Spirochaetes bacterium GWF1_41_5]HBE03067.1 hypothetical protein [Spirochaetia bacterium]
MITNKKVSILIADDEEHILHMLKDCFGGYNYNVDCVTNGQEALEQVLKKRYTLVIADVKMPKMDGITLLKKIKEIDENIYVLMITGYADISVAVEAMKFKAYDFITKPFSLTGLALLVNKIIENENLKNEQAWLHDRNAAECRLQNILGVNKQKKKLSRVLAPVINNQAIDKLALSGPPGSGKSFIARVFHYSRTVYPGQYIEFPADAYAEPLQYTELFGQHINAAEKISENKKGVFEMAFNGTVHIKNLEYLPNHIQVKLLRAIIDREVLPLGSKNSISIKCNMVFSSTVYLKKLVKDRRLREDLYMAIASSEVRLIPVSEQKEHLFTLIDYFMRDTCEKYKTARKKPGKEAERILFSYDWPGNIREIKHVCEEIVLKAAESVIKPEHLPPGLASAADKSTQSLSLEDLEVNAIRNALAYAAGNKTSTANLLGIHRKQLYRKLEKYGLTD